ncbi:MAG: D-alanyl-D-alanine carboxypeptidase, partial [Alphaproteobacteria bacterium]|nr:D-alanyl-D-alanine carboxypeptidase [Alphaproteobacteria bacterium]
MNLRLFLACLLALSGLSGASAVAQISPVPSPSGLVPAGPYLVVDAASGEALLQRSAGAPWYPASLAKLMTIYLVFEELKAGRLNLSSPLPFSAHAASMPPSKLGVGPGGSVPVELALQALVVRSANDVAAAFGDLLSGSEPTFAKRMTDTARRLGMTATTFRNASGLPDPDQQSSARDLAMLAMALMRDFPQYYPYFHTQEFTYGKHRIGPGVKFLDVYSPYADGLKTGFICSSGFNIVGSAVRDGRRLIGVAFGFRR